MKDETEQLPGGVRSAMYEVVFYYLDDERRDFEQCPVEDRPRHIYMSLLEIVRWLNGEDESIDSSTPDAPATPASSALKSANPRRTIAINAFASGKRRTSQRDVSVHATSVYNAYKPGGRDDA